MSIKQNILNLSVFLAQDAQPIDYIFNSDKTKLFMLGGVSASLYSYTLVTPGDVNTLFYDNACYSFLAQDISPLEVFFKPDECKLFMLGGVSASLYSYTLVTLGDINTLFYDNACYSFLAQDISPQNAGISYHGGYLYIDSCVYVLQRAGEIETAIFKDWKNEH